jgi:hypothetical protein
MASAIRKPLTRNAGQIDPTPSLQQNAESSAAGMTRECDPNALTALLSIDLEMANCVPSRLRWQLRHR